MCLTTLRFDKFKALPLDTIAILQSYGVKALEWEMLDENTLRCAAESWLEGNRRQGSSESDRM